MYTSDDGRKYEILFSDNNFHFSNFPVNEKIARNMLFYTHFVVKVFDPNPEIVESKIYTKCFNTLIS